MTTTSRAKPESPTPRARSAAHADEGGGAALLSRPALLLTLLAATLVAWYPSLRELTWLDRTDASAKATLWTRVALCVGVTIGGLLVERIARALRAAPVAALGAALLFVASAASTSLAWDASGLWWLLATVAWLVVVERRVGGASEPWVALAASVAAIALSRGAFAPIVGLTWLAPSRVERSGRERWVGALFALALVAAIVASYWCPAGLAVDLDASASGLRSRHSPADLRALGSIGRSLVATTAVVRSWPADLSTIAVVVVGGAIVTLLALEWRRARATAFALGLLLLGGAVTLDVATRAAPAVLLSLGLLLPVAATLAWLAATSWKGLAPLLAVGCLVADVVPGLGVRHEPRSMLRAALPNPCAALRLAELEHDPVPLEEATLAATRFRPALTEEAEERLGLAAATLRENGGDAAGALAWLDRWLRDRGAEGDAALLPAARSRRLALVLEQRGADAGAALVASESAQFAAEPRYGGRVAAEVVDALLRRARDAKFVGVMLPVAERLLERAASRPESASADELASLALLRVPQQRYVDAVNLAEQAIARDPTSTRPHVVLARIYLDRGERDAGLKEVLAALKLDAKDPVAQFVQGRLQCTNADVAEQGVDDLLTAFVAAPTMAGARDEIDDGVMTATTALLARERAPVATKVCERAIAAIGRRPVLLHALGRSVAVQRQHQRAVDVLEEAFAARPDLEGLRLDLAESRRDRGYSFLLTNHRDQAVPHFERAVELAKGLDPKQFDPHAMLSVLRAAREGLETVKDPQAELDAAAAKIAFDDGVRLYSAGDKDGAKQAFLKSIEKVATNPYAHLNLGRIELQLGDAKAAEGSLRTAIAVGMALGIDVEDAYPLLVRALLKQEASAAKIAAVVDEYLERYPKGRHRDELSKLKPAKK
jgi:tetratricopeptide (TPR) repeat protein